MRDLGTLWKRCNNGDIQKGEWDYERRLTIDGVVYHDEDIIKVTHDKGLVANSFSLGNTISGSIKATVIPHTDHTVRRNGKILLELRIVTLNDGFTEWFEFGHYYINSAKREKDKWTIEGYDAINQLETPFVTSNTNWPQSCTNAINQILNFLSIDLDPRTNINSSLQIQDPTEFTMREVLGYIGGLHGGNWYITETNKLRLVIPSLGTKVATVLPGNTKKLVDSGVMNFDKVILKFSSSVKDKYTSGSGKNELEVYNPWGTQSTADNIRSILSDYDYYPGEYKSTEINPAIELGDTIEIDGKLVNLWQVNYSTRIYADIYMPDQTDKYRDTYDFVVGGDSDGGDYEDRIDSIEEMLGIRGCFVIPDISIERGVCLGPPCVIIPRVINDDVIVREIDGLFRSGVVSKVINNSNNLTSMARLFSGSKVASIDLSRLNAENVTNMSAMFERSDAKTIDLSNFNTSSALDMSRMFFESQVNTLNLSSFNTSNVTHMNNMFRDTKVITLNLNNFNTSSVIDMSEMFYLSKATTIDVSSFDTSNVTNMNRMFANSRATTLDVSSFNTSKVTNMASMFSVSPVTILDVSSFNTSNVVYMNGMFAWSRVATLDLSSFDTSSVTDMNRMFWNSETTTLDISSFDTSNVTDMNGMFWNSEATILDTSSFDTSNVTDMNRMFGGSKATILDTSSFDTSNVTNMAYMFWWSKVNTLDLSSFDTSNVTNMDGMFRAMINIEELDLSSFNLDNIELSESMIPGRFVRKHWSKPEISETPLTIYCRTESDLNKMKVAYFNTYSDYFESDNLATFVVK